MQSGPYSVRCAVVEPLTRWPVLPLQPATSQLPRFGLAEPKARNAALLADSYLALVCRAGKSLVRHPLLHLTAHSKEQFFPKVTHCPENVFQAGATVQALFASLIAAEMPQ